MQDVVDKWKHFGQFFKLMADYAEFGQYQRMQLLRLDVLPLLLSFLMSNTFASKYHKPDYTYAVCSVS